MDKKLKHLEFIQNLITRMNTNSFLIKGWCITITSALFALAAKDSNLNFVLVTYVSLPVFWILDGFFLATERRYRELYKEVSIKSDTEIDFSLNAERFCSGDRTWLAATFSRILVLFYGILLITTLIVMFLIK